MGNELNMWADTFLPCVYYMVGFTMCQGVLLKFIYMDFKWVNHGFKRFLFGVYMEGYIQNKTAYCLIEWMTTYSPIILNGIKSQHDKTYGMLYCNIPYIFFKIFRGLIKT